MHLNFIDITCSSFNTSVRANQTIIDRPTLLHSEWAVYFLQKLQNIYQFDEKFTFSSIHKARHAAPKPTIHQKVPPH